MSQFGAGVGGLVANASGAGSLGEIHLSVFADNGQFNKPVFFTTNGRANTFAYSEITFFDRAIVPGPIGALLTLDMSLPIDGAFSGDGEVHGTFAFGDPNVGISLVQDVGANSFAPSTNFKHTFKVLGGDQLFWRLDLIAEAGSSNDSGILQTSAADVSHTAHLFFDLPSGQGLIGATGHNYASTLPGGATVPEPSAWAMLIAGFGGVGAVLRRSRRMSAGMAKGQVADA